MTKTEPDLTFRELVAWAERHILEGISKNAYQHAVWTVCERVAKWRFDQDNPLDHHKVGI